MRSMSRSNPLFYGKILLFGEYGIIKDSMGLSIPHTYYKGAFQFEPTFNEEQSKSNENLFKYLTYLKSDKAPCRFNTTAFENDLNNGLYFDSSIPQGFGVGSSGALVAAIYDRYCERKSQRTHSNHQTLRH